MFVITTTERLQSDEPKNVMQLADTLLVLEGKNYRVAKVRDQHLVTPGGIISEGVKDALLADWTRRQKEKVD